MTPHSSKPHPIVQTALPLLALCGRPNVGKSTLFNRIVGGHHAIVEDQPGVTRDRRYGEAEYDGLSFRVVDTGGLDFAATGSIAESVLRQSLRAIEEAAVVVFVVDAQQGLLPDDRAAFERLRRTGKPVIIAGNKVDGARHEEGVGELYALGAAQVFPISAAHGRGMPDLLAAIVDAIEEATPARRQRREKQPRSRRGEPAEHAPPHRAERAPAPPAKHDEDGDPDEHDEEPLDTATAADVTDGGDSEEAAVEEKPELIRIALVGRPNAGKSSLINALCGEERMIVDPTPGTTRDPVDTLIEHQGQRFLLIDTAGIRRRAKVYEPMEKVAVAMAEKAVNRADVTVLVIDGEGGIGEQDAKIAGLCEESGRALLIVFNKRDLFDARHEEKLREDLKRQLQFVPWAEVMVCSARTQRGVLRILDTARRVYRSYARRVSTGALNRFFSGIVQKHPPPLHQGRPIRLYYITQAQAKPPTFVVSVNHPEGMHFSYRRYLQNQLRETFEFVGTPVRLIARARNRAS
ncbi:MAG: ribosome biogenesis GTPase Der [Polyangia bacterium]